MKLGYVRSNVNDNQDKDKQIKTLREQGLEKIFIDECSANDEKPQLKELIKLANEGDEVYTNDISRFGRNTIAIVGIVEDLNKRKVSIKTLKEGLDTSTPIGRAMFSTLGSMLELANDEEVNARIEKNMK